MHRTVILGASGTIGAALSRRLVADGGAVLLLGRSLEKLQALSVELDQPFAVVESTSSESLIAAVRQASESFGTAQAFVNCIGSILLRPAHLTTDTDFVRVVETNLFTAFATVRAGSTLMKESGGSIVLFASAAAEIGIANHEAIAAAKAGVIGLARSAAASYAPNNIRVNVVSPGLIRTELTKRIWDTPASAAASTQMHALQRLGEPKQVVSLVRWLLDAENDWVTGQVIGIDGGLGHILPRR